jgi:putative ABC transport system permease protein
MIHRAAAGQKYSNKRDFAYIRVSQKYHNSPLNHPKLSLLMLRNYLIVAWRNLLRNPTFSIINLLGLSLSVAFCLLLFYHIRWEQSFDAFHVKKDRLFRVEMSIFGVSKVPEPAKGLFAAFNKDNDQKNSTTFPLVVGPDVQHNFPEVTSFTRFKLAQSLLIRAGKAAYKEEQVISAEPNFFTNLSFPLLKGDAHTALSNPENVVLSASTAKKYFGNTDPIGQTISVIDYEGKLYRVTGVVADAPANSSIQYGAIFALNGDPYYENAAGDGFNSMNHELMVELRPGVDAHKFEQKLNAWVAHYMKPYMDTVWNKDAPASVRDNYRWYLRPLADCHYSVATVWGHYTDVKAIYQLGCIAVVILLLASLNYILIAVSNAAARGQEVGVRKVMGAGRRGIIVQSWVETQLTAGIAVIVGVLLSWLGLPLLRNVIGSGVYFGDLSPVSVITAALVLTLLLGVLAGYYPALLVSRLKPLSIIKSFGSVRMNPRFSRVLVVVQFACCVVLMMAAFVIDRQMSFVTNKNLGFDKEQVLVIHNPTWDPAFMTNTRDRLFAFARTQPAVTGFSSMSGGLTGGYNTNGFKLNGKQQWMKQISVDYGFFDLLKIPVVTGRNFSSGFAMDTAQKVRACVVNETLWKMLGKDAKLGVYNEGLRATVIGVVKDYNFESLSQKIEPEQHMLARRFASDFLFKVKAGQMAAAISAFEEEWKRATHNYPFNYTFLDASIARMYEADLRSQRAMGAASGFAIIIACMGLFGLSAIAAANRVKEIGIRKVLGASVQELVLMLSTGFLSMVGLAIVIAVPIAWWMMNKWLEDFAYRIAIQWWMFAVVGLMAVVIALVTVGFQVVRAARANPVEALRNE